MRQQKLEYKDAHLWLLQMLGFFLKATREGQKKGTQEQEGQEEQDQKYCPYDHTLLVE